MLDFDALQAALEGVAEGNAEHGVDYAIEAVHFVAGDTGPASVYRGMARRLV